jgi:hypothetical protein
MGGGRILLKMNFSVVVNMYKANVTSYWYRFRCSQRASDDGYSMRARRSVAAAVRRIPVEMATVSGIVRRVALGGS